jgi:hypothetical protein
MAMFEPCATRNLLEIRYILQVRLAIIARCANCGETMQQAWRLFAISPRSVRLTLGRRFAPLALAPRRA